MIQLTAEDTENYIDIYIERFFDKCHCEERHDEAISNT